MKDNTIKKQSSKSMNEREAKAGVQTENERIICETIVKNAMMTGGVMYARVPLHLLNIPEYQRSRQRYVDKIAAHWDDQKCKAILVSYRDGKFWVVDGQNRTAAAELVGKEDMFCQILTGKTMQEEFDYYENQDRYEAKVSYGQKVGGGSRIGVEPYKTIDNVLRQCGATSRFHCYKSAIDTYNRDGKLAIMWILNLINDLDWSHAPKGYSRTIFKSLAEVYHKCEQSENPGMVKIAARDVLIRLFKNVKPAQVILDAQNEFPHLDGELAPVTAYMESKVFTAR